MILDSVTFDDNYESGFEQKRVITHTLGFTAKTYLFGPVSDSGSGLIKKVQVDYELILIQELQQDLRGMLLHQELLKIITMMESQDLQKILLRYKRNSWYKILRV